MAIVNKFTATLPNPTATHVDGFVFLLSTQWFVDAANAAGAAGSPIDGGAKSLANGGGDIQAFADSACTQQLPIHVVEFVTGGSPSAKMWVRRASWAAGDTITIAKDNFQTVQPLPSSTYGQHNVWQDYICVYLLDDLSDAAGNADLFVFQGSPLKVADGYDFDGSSLLASTPTALTTVGVDPRPVTIQATGRVRDLTTNAFRVSVGIGAQIGVGGYDISTGTYNSATGSHLLGNVPQNQGVVPAMATASQAAVGDYWYSTFSVDAAGDWNLNGFNGQDFTDSGNRAWASNGNPLDTFGIGGRIDSSESPTPCIVTTAKARFGIVTIAKEGDERANQSNPDNFATIGAWVDVGATTNIPWWLFQNNEVL